MQVQIHSLDSQKGHPYGIIMTAITNGPINQNQKNALEAQLRAHAHEVLYPGTPITIFSDVNNDIASICVIEDINILEQHQIVI